jgi:hypothetical protein
MGEGCVMAETLTYKGITKTIPEWAEAVGLETPTLRYRLKAGWSIKNALFRPCTQGMRGKNIRLREGRRMALNRQMHPELF